MDEWDKDKREEIFGVKISKSEVGVRYDYTKDGVWNDLNSELEPIKDKIKEREKFLKTLQQKVADIDTGEIIEPPVKLSTTALKLSIK